MPDPTTDPTSPSTDRYALFAGVDKLLSLVDPPRLLASMRGVGDWLEAASEATGQVGCCYRTAMYREGSEVKWLYPNSNTPELISAWLDLADALGEDRYRTRAIAYGERLVSDPVHGLYRGEVKEAHGLAWYWRDDATYTGGYSMRAPEALLRLYQQTGDERYREACDAIGETFLARQLESGIVSMVGWCPKRGWLHSDLMGSRYVYPLATFATLFGLTSDPRYRIAYEKVVGALLEMQQADGSFYQHYHPATLKVLDGSIKLHFFAYIFNALAEGYALFADARLVEVGRGMARYLAEIFYYRQGLPYCVDPVYASDLAEADSAVQDNANGLFWLYSVTGEALHLDLALKLWWQTWATQADTPENPSSHGAVLRGVQPGLGQKPEAGGQSAHLAYDAANIARCEVWFQANHVFATRRLLDLVKAL